jgi:hypothetical protein
MTSVIIKKQFENNNKTWRKKKPNPESNRVDTESSTHI